MPQTQGELFAFYHEKVKPLYAEVQVYNTLPQEVLFEIHAAFDHLSRCHIADFNESEAKAVEKAYSHLKRACLDIFKLKVVDVIDKYKELQRLDTSLIDNGKFDQELHELIARIQRAAREARRFEGRQKFDASKKIEAFELWEPVMADCATFETNFYLNPNLNWARRKGYQITSKKIITGIIVAALTGAFIKDPLAFVLKSMCSGGYSFFVTWATKLKS